MRIINNSQSTITNALKKPGAETGFSVSDFDNKLTFGSKYPVVASKQHMNGEEAKDDSIMKAQTEVFIVDTNIIPDRNAGIGSLLCDFWDSQDPDRDDSPLLSTEFAFIDVGVSRAKVSITLKTLLAKNLRMNVNYVSTELFEAVPYAYITPLGARAEKIRSYLSGLITTRENTREVMDWYYAVDVKGKVSSVAYSYNQVGNEVWESYYMGRTFMVSGEKVEFTDPTLDEMLTYDIKKIEAIIDLERKRHSAPSLPVPSWDGYKVEKNPLEAGLAEFDITLQKTDVPHRIKGRQNVLFLGNVLNHYPKDQQTRELDRIAANMKDGDIVIVQVDELDACFIEVLKVKEHGVKKTHERVRWINTKKLEVLMPVRGADSWQEIHLKPVLDRIVSRLIDCLGRKVISPKWNQKDQKLLARQKINHVFATFFRALPVEETLCIAIREALRRLSSKEGLKGIPVFRDDTKDAFGGALGSDQGPIVSEADINNMKLKAKVTASPDTENKWKTVDK